VDAWDDGGFIVRSRALLTILEMPWPPAFR
jgi:hypothetical protein